MAWMTAQEAALIRGKPSIREKHKFQICILKLVRPGFRDNTGSMPYLVSRDHGQFETTKLLIDIKDTIVIKSNIYR